MRRLTRALVVGWMAGWMAGCIGGTAAAAGFADPIETPALLTPRALSAPVFALAAGDGGTLLGVGPRGHILRSPDGGASWAQVASPVQTDLVAVAFAGPRTAWAVGHDGVILRSDDAGSSWHKQLDGRSLGPAIVAHYEALAAARPDAAVQRALDDARKAAAGGAALSLLAVWFRNEREGFIAGQFNLILHTRDGGKSWQPWLERTDNPDNLSLHAIAGDGQQVWIAGELGLLLRLDAAGERFRRVESPYRGSWFGIDVRRDSVLAFGLRGNAWRSDDGGARWRRLDTETDQQVNAGALLDDGGAVLLTARGRLLMGAAAGGALANVAARGQPLAATYALARLAPGSIAIGTARGVVSMKLSASAR